MFAAAISTSPGRRFRRGDLPEQLGFRLISDARPMRPAHGGAEEGWPRTPSSVFDGEQHELARHPRRGSLDVGGRGNIAALEERETDVGDLHGAIVHTSASDGRGGAPGTKNMHADTFGKTSGVVDGEVSIWDGGTHRVGHTN